jgi:hypothetical protein
MAFRFNGASRVHRALRVFYLTGSTRLTRFFLSFQMKLRKVSPPLAEKIQQPYEIKFTLFVCLIYDIG